MKYITYHMFSFRNPGFCHALYLYMFLMILVVSSDYFLKQHSLNCLCKLHDLCSWWGRNLGCINNFDANQSSQIRTRSSSMVISKGNRSLFIISLVENMNELLPPTRVGTLIVATIYLQLIQNRYMFRGFTVLQCSHQH